MHCRTRNLTIGLAVAAAGVAGVRGAAQEIKLNVTYVCDGERLHVESCNIRDLSDTSTCQVAHPDRPQHNGFMAYTSETRGALKKLLPTCTQPTAQELAREEAFKKKQQEIYDANVAKANPQAAAQNPPPGSGGQGGGNAAQVTPPKNAEERAMRRCVSSGRPATTCTGNGLLGAFSQMLSQVLPGADKQPAPGPNMAGVFQGAGNWRLDFIDNGVLVNCAELSPNQESYALDLKSGHATLTIDTTPRPLVLAVHGDGTITGPPGPVTINGVIAAGYVSGAAGTGATQQDSAGNLYDAAGNRVPGNANAGYTRFAPRRATCPTINLSSKGAGAGVQTMETDLLKSIVGGDKGPPAPVGIRMHGIFASAATGFSMQFFPESAILGCGPDAARAYPYTVVTGGASAVINIAAPDHPLALAVRPDGSLDPGSSGAYLVHGRIVTGQDDNDDFTFAPMEMTCNLGVLTPSQQIPASGGAPGMMNASAGGPGANPAGGGGLSTPAAPLGNAVLSVVPGLAAQPGAPSPFAGRPFVLLRTSYADAVARSGATVPAGVSPYMYVGVVCANRTPDCQKIMSAINADAASAVRADANGRGTFPGVQPGVYYLMISALYNNKPFAWDQAVQLKAGANSVTLDLSNATAIK